MNVKKHISYTLTCKCGESTTVEQLTDLKTTHPEWFISCNSVPVRQENIKEILCPACKEKRRLEKYNSGNILDRIHAGYYRDHPEKFYDDAIDDVGLKEHPKASKAYEFAYDRGHSSGHGDVYSYLVEIAELLLGSE